MSNAIEPGSTLANLIPTLDLSKVPETLHCTQCQEFLLNPYKTSCCDSKLCEKCYENLPEHCPKCKHKPFSKDLCSVAKAARGTAKAYLRNVEKSQAEDRNKVKTIETNTADDAPLEYSEPTASHTDNTNGQSISIEPAQTEMVVQEGSPAIDVQPSIEIPADQAQDEQSESSDDGDDEVEIQVEPSAEDEYHHQPHHSYLEDEDPSFNKPEAEHGEEENDDSRGLLKDADSLNRRMSSMGMNMNNNMNSNNNMELNPMAMMQQMQQMMMMNGMNPMMGMPQGMNPGMFGGFAGQNGGINGMNMGMMNFNTNQNMFGWNGQNNNSWQNNNGNAYSNGMSNDFNQQYGFDMSQQGSFQQQSFRNGDFQNGYSGYRGRGRGRGRGFGRGRGSFNQYSQNSYHGYQNAHEQQQSEIQQMQAQMIDSQLSKSGRGSPDITNQRDKKQDRASEALPDSPQMELQEAPIDKVDEMKDIEEPRLTNQVLTIDTTRSPQHESRQPIESSPSVEHKEQQQTATPMEKTIPEAYHEDFDSMAPPSAPVGPSGRYGERDHGFRSRGHGRYATRGRGSFSIQNGHPASPVRSISQSSIVAPSSPAKGLGVQGAPTGPKAMREPSIPKPAPRSNPGLEIRGRASQHLHSVHTGDGNRTRSVSPAAGYDDRDDGRAMRKHEKPESREPRYDDESEAGYDRNERDRDRDRKRRKSRRDDYEDDYDMQETNNSYSRSDSHDRKQSHRSSRYDKERDKEKVDKSSKHRSSRRYYDEDANGDHDMDDYGDPSDDRTSKHRSSHKTSGKTSSKYDERDERREDRHRKRSRHDRDREDEHDDEEDDDESRHRSRRHKKEHHSSSKRDREREREKEKEVVDDDMGLRISGRSSKTTPALPTPTSVTAPSDFDKDPHTLEREARNKERMQKEQQRREKAAMDKISGTQKRGTVSGGRRVSYKYEDEVERNMDERDNARWR